MNVTFSHPIYLWLLISIPLMIITHFFLLAHTRKKAMRFANFEALQRITGNKILTKNWGVLILRIVILSCLIFSVAGTVFWYRGLTNENNFVIAIDGSASMTAQDIKPTRIDAAKSFALKFVDSMKSDSELGVIRFSGTTFIEQTLTTSKAEAKKAIENIMPMKAGGTDIASAIITGSNLLINSEKGRTILLFTDGSSTVGMFEEDSVKAGIDYAKLNHVIIHTIGVGSETGPIGYIPEYYNIPSVYNEEQLFRISNLTGGKYYDILTNEQLDNALQDVTKATKEAFISVQLSFGLMLTALLLLFLEWGLINTRYRKIP